MIYWPLDSSMSSNRMNSKKLSKEEEQSTFHRIGSFPRHMSRSWPVQLNAIGDSEDEKISIYHSINDLTNLHECTESSAILSWLGSVLNMSGLVTSTSSFTSNFEDYPTRLPYKKLINESKVSVFSNNLQLGENICRLSGVSTLRLTKNIFYLNGAGITQLPDSFASLNGHLKELDLRGNPLETFPGVLLKLTSLTILNLENCKLTSVPEQISNLDNLKKLFLDNNQIRTLSSCLAIKSLEHLSLGNNGIEDISGIRLLNIKALDLSENLINEISEDIFKDSTLKRLVLSNNSIQKLPNSICTIKTLKYLDVSKNIVKKLPDEFGNLLNLKYLNISWNDLTALPESITKLTGLKKHSFYCGENPLRMPPYEVAIEGPQRILSYFKALKASKEKYNSRRLKLMILGNEKTGKTTLAKAIYSYAEPEPVEETVGVDFFEWQAEIKPDGLRVMIVDCAGQKKYVLTHQLFMQTGLLFAVVVNLAEYCPSLYEEAIGEWIDLILARVPKAVIMVVPTFIDKCDAQQIKERCEHILQMLDNKMEKICVENEMQDLRGSCWSLDNLETPFLPSKYLLAENGEIKEYPDETNSMLLMRNNCCENEPAKVFMIPVSNVLHLEGLTILRDEIIRIAYDKRLSPNASHVVPDSWIKLEQVCKKENKSGKTISVDELNSKVSDSFETRKDLIDALKYIDSLGTILFFHAIPGIRDIVFLDSVWFSSIFKLIFRHDSEEFFVFKDEYKSIYEFEREFYLDKHYLLSTATMSYDFLRCIWYNDIKEVGYFNKIVELLKSFDLAYDITLENHEQPYLLVPWFLPENCDKLKLQYDHLPKESICCIIETNVKLQDGFFQRFIVKVNQRKLFIEIIPWVSGFIALTKLYRITVTHQIKGRHSCIIIEGHAEKCDVYHMWEVLIPLMQSLKDFIKEWPGIKMKLFSFCPSCKQHRHTDNAQFWELNLKKICEQGDKISCRLEGLMVDKWKAFPPPPIAMKFLPTDLDKTTASDDRLQHSIHSSEKQDYTDHSSYGNVKIATSNNKENNELLISQRQSKSNNETDLCVISTGIGISTPKSFQQKSPKRITLMDRHKLKMIP